MKDIVPAVAAVAPKAAPTAPTMATARIPRVPRTHDFSTRVARGRADPVRRRASMAARKASDVLVECLEAEGVQYVFGIPGEEPLDLTESLPDSSIRFIPVRHEQGGAY